MNDRRQEFKKWLIDNMKASSNADYSTIITEVNSYSTTQAFEIAYLKWLKKCAKNKMFKGVKHIGEIFESM